MAGPIGVFGPRQRPSLVLHRQLRQTQLPALEGQEPIRVARLRRPQWTTEEPDELEQHRPVTGHRAVHAARADRREQVLVHQFLLEVLTFLASRQTPGSVQRPDHGQPHDHPRSPNPTVDRQYRQPVRNPDRMSTLTDLSACRTWPGPRTFASNPVPRELRGDPVGLADLIDDADL